ncbi:MAG: exopolysaccharide biosynthesis protein [Lysobacteraceae bacterium]
MSPASPTLPPPDADMPLRCSTMLAMLAQSGSGDSITLDEILSRFRSRAYGVLLMLVLLPAFLPLPIGAGAVSGPLVSVIGIQMLLTLQAPWLPRRARQQKILRTTLGRFAQRMQRFLGRLERLCRPRMTALTQHVAAHMFTGLQLIALGILLSLPIPLTNYPFALLLLLYAIALIERDGVLLLVAWVLGCGTIAASAALSSEVIELVGRLLP